MKLSWQSILSSFQDANKVFSGRDRYMRVFTLLRRIEKIYRKKSKHSISEKHQAAAELIFHLCVKNGAMWIKVGQYLSCRPDLLPEEYINVFSDLQAISKNHAPRSFNLIQETLVDAWGADWDSQFQSFNIVPIASGSIAQVYKAQLKIEGGISQDVAIKVRVPDVIELYEQDSIVLKAVAKCIAPFYKEIDVNRVVDEIISATMLELDFSQELQNMEAYNKVQHSTEIQTPVIYNQLCSQQILVTSWLNGPTLKKLLKDKSEKILFEKSLSQFTAALMQDIFIHGLYHGDPHPGNIIIDNEKVYVIDFGLMGRLEPQQRFQYMTLLMAMTGKLANADFANLFIAAGFKAEDESIFNEIGSFINELHDNKDLDVKQRLEKVVESLRKNKVILPQGFIGILRVVILLSGLFYACDLDFDEVLMKSMSAA